MESRKTAVRHALIYYYSNVVYGKRMGEAFMHLGEYTLQQFLNCTEINEWERVVEFDRPEALSPPIMQMF